MKIAKALWIGAYVLVLMVTFYAFDGKPNSDIGSFFVWYMLALSFPSGLLVPIVHVVLYDGLSIAVETSYLSLMLNGAGFFILGYFQWFRLLPYLIAKLGSRKVQQSLESKLPGSN